MWALMRCCVVTIGILSFLQAPAKAATIYHELPEFRGYVESYVGPASDGRSTNFDLGVNFKSIEAVYVDFAVSDIAQGTLDSGNSFDLSLSVRTGPDEPVSHDTAKPFIDGQYTHRVLFDNYVPDVIDFYSPFRDGQGTLTLFSNVGFFCPSEGCRIPNVVTPAAGNIIDARLVVVGTLVPEPSGALLTLIATMAVVTKGRRRRL